ncbi:hypothetical protein HOY80DRAFT_1109969 [Tuber brumale]|nr:hypothetical protein HOY80DRAFT_1109969 [Tuber brumale]
MQFQLTICRLGGVEARRLINATLGDMVDNDDRGYSTHSDARDTRSLLRRLPATPPRQPADSLEWASILGCQRVIDDIFSHSIATETKRNLRLRASNGGKAMATLAASSAVMSSIKDRATAPRPNAIQEYYMQLVLGICVRESVEAAPVYATNVTLIDNNICFARNYHERR